MEYDFRSIEKKWQTYWDEHKTFKVTEDPAFPPEKRRYVLDMFPYPSGAGLHVGHPEGYTATDIYCRYMRMNGYNVLHPMGFDSFGLPAENYAIKTGTHPKVTTEKNINVFREQIKSLGFSYDWDREVSTCTPDYYKWTQWFFLQMFKKGLAYEAQIPINWCPSCKTGLANEEVKEGHCERCGTQVHRKNLRQWVLKITAYAERLLKDVDKLDWPEPIKIMQRNWIGKSTGAEVTFEIENGKGELTVYTTRPDTLFGVTYMVLSPEHPLVDKITTPDNKEAVEKYVHDAALKSDLERTDLNKDKTGVFTGAYAINPLNNERVPIWISDYVLISYGTGAIMAVPAHDSRDWEFAKKFGLPIIEVLKGDVDVQEQVYEGDGPHVNSGFLNGMGVDEAIETVIKWLEERGKGHKAVNYKLRDWVFSRQRYWGEPMPLIHCPHCGTVPVPEDQLPLQLPEVQKYEPTGTGESPLANVDEWVNCTCPVCGAPAKRETNTMPQWAGSCWYYLRYLDPHNDKEFASREAIDYWMPVDLYVGGAEHAVLHLLYARFWHKVLFDLGLVNTDEPFMRLVNQGMLTSFAYQRPDKSLVAVDQVDENGGVYTEKGTGVKLERVIAKMSKSLKNVINPDEIIKEYGADSLRLYEMFMGPLQMSKPWSTQGLQGVHRFLQKVWKVCTKPLSDEPMPADLKKLLHKSIKKISTDTETLNFNTAISQMMVLINEAGKCDCCYREMMDPFARMLSAYAPHMAEELWELLGNAPSVAKTKWPSFDPTFAVDDMVTIPVQFSGKVREKLDLPAGLDKDALLAAVMENENVKKRLEGKTIIKTIVVPGKLVNLVVK